MFYSKYFITRCGPLLRNVDIGGIKGKGEESLSCRCSITWNKWGAGFLVGPGKVSRQKAARHLGLEP